MKLLFFIYSLGSGGAERATVNLANQWASKGWDIVLVTLAPRSDDFFPLDPAVKRVALELAGDSRGVLSGLGRNLHRAWALRRVLREEKPAIALGMMATANVVLALAAWGLPQLRAIGCERAHPAQLPLGRPWEALRRVAYGRLAAIAALTADSACWIRERTRARTVAVIPNAVAWPLPMHTPRVAPHTIFQPERLLLLAVGRAATEKQHDLLLDVFRRLAVQHSEWDLVVLGEGPRRRELLARAQSAGLSDRVFFPGRVGNVGEWYQRAQLYVLSSSFEGFPNSLLEAMACGVPAVSFDCATGPRDIVRHGVDGLLVPAGDAAGLAIALDRVMGDAALRLRFAARCVDARERFSIERITTMWGKLFEELID